MRTDSYELIAGEFPGDVPASQPFDAITMLAVLEHISTTQHSDLRDECVRLLKPGGLFIITVPSPVVDPMLALLKRLRLVAGMALHEHHGFNPKDIPSGFQVMDSFS